MIKPCKAGGFGPESLDEIGVAQQFRTQRLHRHFALQDGVEGGVDLSDAAFAQQFADLVLADHPVHEGEPGIGILMRRVCGSCARLSSSAATMPKIPSEALSWPPASSAASINASQASCGGKLEATSAI